MVIINFPSGTDWYKANWVFRQLARDIAERFPEDRELTFELEKAQAFGGLDFPSCESDVRARIMKAMTSVCDATLQGKIAGWKETKPDDQAGQGMYLEAIAELLVILKNEANEQ